MDFCKYFVITLMGIAMLFALHQGIALIFIAHGWKGMTAGDWGTWIGAVGTVSTLAGTIWLATSERRKLDKKELELAKVTAAGFVMRILVVTNALKVAIAVLRDFEEQPNRIDFRRLHALMENVDLWEPHETVALVALPGSVAASLSRWCTTLKASQQNLCNAAVDQQMLHDDKRGEFLAHQRVMYEAALAHLKEDFKVCREASGVYQVG